MVEYSILAKNIPAGIVQFKFKSSPLKSHVSKKKVLFQSSFYQGQTVNFLGMYLVDHVEVVRVASLQGDWQDDFPFAVGDTRSMWNGIVEVQERQ